MGDDGHHRSHRQSGGARIAVLHRARHGSAVGRKEAKRRFNRAQMDQSLQAHGVTLVAADLDESPMAYRRLPEVLADRFAIGAHDNVTGHAGCRGNDDSYGLRGKIRSALRGGSVTAERKRQQRKRVPSDHARSGRR